jgi:hypothetical protein
VQVVHREPSTATATTTRLLEVAAGDELGVRRGLVRGKVRDEPLIATRGDIAVEHEDAPSVAGSCDDLALAAAPVDVAAELAFESASRASARSIARCAEVMRATRAWAVTPFDRA